MPQPTRYSTVAIILHWLIALAMTAAVVLAWSFDDLPDAWVRLAVDSHKSFGITVLVLAALRLLWRIGNPPPAMPESYTIRERRTAHIVHILLYAVMLALPLTGYIHDSAWEAAATHPNRWFGLFEWPRIGAIMALPDATKLRVHDGFALVHTYLGDALYVLFALHVAGALKHQFTGDKNGLARIWPARRS